MSYPPPRSLLLAYRYCLNRYFGAEIDTGPAPCQALAPDPYPDPDRQALNAGLDPAK
jgi:hypothetical protein